MESLRWRPAPFDSVELPGPNSLMSISETDSLRARNFGASLGASELIVAVCEAVWQRVTISEVLGKS